jgi:hypothetical protein
VSTRPPILRYFDSSHLPRDLRDVSVRFEALAQWVSENLPGSAEQSTALRKLLEAKDAAVRAALPADDMPAASQPPLPHHPV